jgi:c-di-GMP-binding flagellar brake protein YcgR
MEQPTIEFSPVPDDTDPHFRHVFRVPVHEAQGVSFFISDVGYRVSEIGQTGIGLLLEHNQTFEIGECFDTCRLLFDEIVLTNLTGRVVHCSPHEDLWKFGIQWIELTGSQKQLMDQLFSMLKKRVMASSQSSEAKGPGREK